MRRRPTRLLALVLLGLAGSLLPLPARAAAPHPGPGPAAARAGSGSGAGGPNSSPGGRSPFDPGGSPAPAPGTPAARSGPAATPGAGATPGATPATASAARAEAAAAARRVGALTAAYQQREEAVRQAAAALAQAFVELAAAQVAEHRDAQAFDSARSLHAVQVRALYAGGGPLGLLATVLSADTSEDMLWRLSTAERIDQDVITRAAVQARMTRSAAVASAAHARVTEAAANRLSTALTALQDQAAAAEAVLAQARAELTRLTVQARHLQVVEDAARRLAQAQAAAEAARVAGAAPGSDSGSGPGSGSGSQDSPGPSGALDIPAGYLLTYRAATTTCPGLPWSLLAAVGQVESGHGRNQGPSSAGAVGPMQFMPATFAAYAVDGNRDGVKDPWNYADAIFTAARYLCVSGAQGGTDAGIRAALLHYNHSQWYVDLVLGAQRAIIARFGAN